MRGWTDTLSTCNHLSLYDHMAGKWLVHSSTHHSQKSHHAIQSSTCWDPSLQSRMCGSNSEQWKHHSQ